MVTYPRLNNSGRPLLYPYFAERSGAYSFQLYGLCVAACPSDYTHYIDRHSFVDYTFENGSTVPDDKVIKSLSSLGDIDVRKLTSVQAITDFIAKLPVPGDLFMECRQSGKIFESESAEYCKYKTSWGGNRTQSCETLDAEYSLRCRSDYARTFGECDYENRQRTKRLCSGNFPVLKTIPYYGAYCLPNMTYLMTTNSSLKDAMEQMTSGPMAVVNRALSDIYNSRTIIQFSAAGAVFAGFVWLFILKNFAKCIVYSVFSILIFGLLGG